MGGNLTLAESILSDSGSAEPSARFPQPDWEEISRRIESTCPAGEWHSMWCAIATAWMSRIKEALAPSCTLSESENFIVISPTSEVDPARLLHDLETMWRAVTRQLAGIYERSFGKGCVILFPTTELFHEYLADYYGDGEYATPGGVFINRGYGHIVLVADQLDRIRGTLCHELCHSALIRLALPLWLEEALVLDIEHVVAGTSPYFLDREIVGRHQRYWTPERLEAFWSGDSFYFPDDGCELSYHLARFITFSLLRDAVPEEKARFVLQAAPSDAGFSAARDVFDVSLPELVDGLVKAL